MGTKATVNSGAYEHELKKINPGAIVCQQSAPLLVPLIEEGWLKKPETKMILKKYLHPLKTKQIDSLILACTHYPFLHREVVKVMGKRVSVPHPGEIVAASLKDYLTRHPELGIKASSSPSIKYYTTDMPENFKVSAEKFLGKKITNLSQADILDK